MEQFIGILHHHLLILILFQIYMSVFLLYNTNGGILMYVLTALYYMGTRAVRLKNDNQVPYFKSCEAIIYTIMMIHHVTLMSSNLMTSKMHLNINIYIENIH